MYKNLLLLNNNIVIDLTKEFLTSGNDNYNDFLNDTEIINKAVCNITFGIGGPFSICNCFSKKVISFIPFLNHMNYYKKIFIKLMKLIILLYKSFLTLLTTNILLAFLVTKYF